MTEQAKALEQEQGKVENNEWMELWDIVCEAPEFTALPKREDFYHEGNYWAPIFELVGAVHFPFVDADAAKLQTARESGMFTLSGWDAWYGRREDGLGRALAIKNPQMPPALCAAFEEIRGAIGNGFQYFNYFDPHDIDALQNKLEVITGYKLHKHARELYLKHIEGDAILNTRGDYCDYNIAGALLMLVKLHGLVVNRFASPIGLGFEDGNPMIILAEPVCRDGHRVDSFRTKSMRLGKWLQSVFGNAVDYRPIVEDMKVLNKPASTYLCMTEREWYDAYENGPSSCMTGNYFDYSPVRVYASTSHGLPDNKLRLFIQYIGDLFGDNFEVQARAIVNVESMEYVRAYGEASDAILRANGYTRNGDCLDDCILARIPHPDYTDAVLMPYLDGDNEYVDDYSVNGVACFMVQSCGDYQALEPDGYIYLEGGECCACCDSRMSSDESYSTEDGEVCENCIDEYAHAVGRLGRYHINSSLTWSDYHDGYVHDNDVQECDIAGPVHDSLQMHDAQRYTVLEMYVEETADGDYILTEKACEHLGEDYLGREQAEDEDEQEEAA